MKHVYKMALCALTVSVACFSNYREADAVTYLTENFTGPGAIAGFIATGGACLTASGTASGNVPQCATGTVGGLNGNTPDASGSGVLRLTTNDGNQAGGVIYTVPQASASGLQAVFTEYAYSGTGADGISFFFLDATQGAAPTTVGALGGSLGYSTGNSGVNGIAEGYIGLGFDEYGNYSNPTEGRNGGPGFVPNTVAIRGVCGISPCTSGSTAGYNYIVGYNNGTGGLPFQISAPTATTRAAATARTWRVTLTPSLLVSIDESNDGGSTYTSIIPATDIAPNNGSSFPAQFYFGFASSTGGKTNIHEIQTFTLASSPVTYSMVTGPATLPAAVGSYDGITAVNNNDDFTERSFSPPSSANYVASYGAVAPAPGATYPASIGPVNVVNQIANTGNVSDTYYIKATAPTGGWTVQIFPDNGGTSTVTTPSTTPLTGSTSGATSTGTITIAAATTATYWAEYTSPAGVATFTRFDAPIVATSTLASAVTNTTHNELYSGFVGTTKNATTSGCAVVVASSVCSGGTITYTLAYKNIALTGGTGNNEPTSALLYTSPGTLIETDDAATNGNNWGTYTNGVSAAVTDTTSGSVIKYGAAPGTTTFTAGTTRFTDQVGGTNGTLGPQQTGTITFTAVAK